MADFTRIDVEENPRNTNDFMLDALFKEAKAENQEVEKENMSRGFGEIEQRKRSHTFLTSH